jgi:hypothetical protein
MNTPQPAAGKSWWYWLRAGGLLAGVGFMGWLLWQLLRDPDLLKNHFTLWGVVAAITIGIVGNLVVGVTFSDMVAKSAPSIGFRRRISAYYYSQIAKYIPGQIAALLVQRSILAGPQASVATLMSNLELMMISCWLCSSAAIVLLVYPASTTGAMITAVVTLAIGTWLIRMNWQPWIRRLIRLIPKYRVLGDGPAKTAKICWLRATCLGAGILLLPALSSYALLTWGLNIDHAMALPLTASLMLAWVVGVLAFVFPAGIGIRELIFFGLGNVLVSAPGAGLMAEVALASRLLHVLMDIVGVALFLALDQLYTHMWRRHPY